MAFIQKSRFLFGGPGFVRIRHGDAPEKNVNEIRKDFCDGLKLKLEYLSDVLYQTHW